jgi:hypothetical protein
MNDKTTITSQDGIGDEINRLRHAGVAHPRLERCRSNVLSSRAALVDALCVRRNAPER